MSKKINEGEQGLIFTAIILISFFVLIGPARGLIWILLPALLVGVIAALLFFIFRSMMAAKAKKAFAKTIEGKIQIDVEKCREQLIKNKTEITEIEENIKDIKSKLQDASDLNTMTKKESERIIKGFEIELKVRREKTSFYQSCLEKLQTILSNHELAKDLESKEEKLRKFQENNYDDISEMEALKTELSLDKVYIESIENLSLRMLQSNSLESAQKLQLELQEITKELRQL